VMNEDATTTKTEGPHVKTMTCRQLGGTPRPRAPGRDRRRRHQGRRPPPPGCGEGRRGDPPAGTRGDEGRWRHLKKSLGWDREAKTTFAALTEH
jgi:hypothetical protein